MVQESDPYSYTQIYDITRTTIRMRESYGDLFKAGAAERIARKCLPFYYAPSCITNMEEAVYEELMWSESRGINRIAQCTGGFRVLVGWQEWQLFRAEMP